MNEENQEQLEAHQNPVEVESNTQDDEQSNEEVLSPEEIADLKRKAEVSSQNYERAKKAEEELRRLKQNGEKKEVVKEEAVNLSPKDYLALTENRVSSEDFDEVVRVAKILNKPISEALKDKTLKSILAERQEERVTAQATQVRSPRSSQKDTVDAILEKARKGYIPTDDAEIEKLAQARMAEKLRKLKR